MSVVVDTSVWSLALRRETPPDESHCRKLETILKQGQPVVLLGVILQEVLQGIRDKARFDQLKAHMEVFPVLHLDREDYVAAAELMNLCRSHGVQTSTTDSQIAAACIRHECSLLTSDRDFSHIAKLSKLQLL